MIDYSNRNLEWLAERHDFTDQTLLLETGDATDYQWQDFDAIACETYLGRPFGSEPAPTVLNEVMRDVDTIHRKFLQNVARQTDPGLKMCIAVPAWHTKSGFKHLKSLDNLSDLGYTRMSFVHVDTRDLLYYRENQVVARELVTLIRK
jgi:tRNA G10  N-methylase Trm11